MVFKYLDKNNDGFISYSEFCFLCEEKRRNIDPFDHIKPSKKTKCLNESSIINDVDIDQDKLERLSMASNFYQGFKSRRLKSKL